MAVASLPPFLFKKGAGTPRKPREEKADQASPLAKASAAAIRLPTLGPGVVSGSFTPDAPSFMESGSTPAGGSRLYGGVYL